jgi:two-component system, cell cycle sensor histidine kinase and response regulator CckA
MLGKMLNQLGFEVSYCVDGQEAVAKYQTARANGSPYDVVFTDLTIPGGMGGQAAAQEILNINPQAKIIVSSGYATDPVLANYEAYGFTGMVAKPYRFAELQEVLQQILVSDEM